MDKLEYYRKNLRHVVRPDNPAEHEEGTYIVVDDWMALYMQRALQDFAAYLADDDEFGIATAYIEYIEMVVRDERKRQVKLFAHTREARWVLDDAMTISAEPVRPRVQDKAIGEVHKLTDAQHSSGPSSRGDDNLGDTE